MEPGNRNGLGYKTFTVNLTRLEVTNAYITMFSMEPFEVLVAIGGVLGFLSGEATFHEDIFPRLFSSAVTCAGSRLILEFGSDADGAFVSNRTTLLELGHTINKFVGMVKVEITAVVEALMP